MLFPREDWRAPFAVCGRWTPLKEIARRTLRSSSVLRPVAGALFELHQSRSILCHPQIFPEEVRALRRTPQTHPSGEGRSPWLASSDDESSSFSLLSGAPTQNTTYPMEDEYQTFAQGYFFLLRNFILIIKQVSIIHPLESQDAPVPLTPVSRLPSHFPRPPTPNFPPSPNDRSHARIPPRKRTTIQPRSGIPGWAGEGFSGPTTFRFSNFEIRIFSPSLTSNRNYRLLRSRRISSWFPISKNISSRSFFSTLKSIRSRSPARHSKRSAPSFRIPAPR